jgi:hypothetical protein
MPHPKRLGRGGGKAGGRETQNNSSQKYSDLEKPEIGIGKKSWTKRTQIHDIHDRWCVWCGEVVPRQAHRKQGNFFLLMTVIFMK